MCQILGDMTFWCSTSSNASFFQNLWSMTFLCSQCILLSEFGSTFGRLLIKRHASSKSDTAISGLKHKEDATTTCPNHETSVWRISNWLDMSAPGFLDGCCEMWIQTSMLCNQQTSSKILFHVIWNFHSVLWTIIRTWQHALYTISQSQQTNYPWSAQAAFRWHETRRLTRRRNHHLNPPCTTLSCTAKRKGRTRRSMFARMWAAFAAADDEVRIQCVSKATI